MRRRTQVFLGLIAACVVVGTVYVAFAIARGSDPEARVSGDARPASEALGEGGRRILFQHIARDDDYAHVAVAKESGGNSRVTSPLVCERVHFSGGLGLCLLPRRSVLGNKFSATIFDSDFAVRGKVNLNGINSRARVSRDGKYGATTGFVVGHSYAAEDFSTETTLIDMASGKKIANVEDFTVRGTASRSRRSTSTSGASRSRATATASTRPSAREARRIWSRVTCGAGA